MEEDNYVDCVAELPQQTTAVSSIEPATAAASSSSSSSSSSSPVPVMDLKSNGYHEASAWLLSLAAVMETHSQSAASASTTNKTAGKDTATLRDSFPCIGAQAEVAMHSVHALQLGSIFDDFGEFSTE